MKVCTVVTVSAVLLFGCGKGEKVEDEAASKTQVADLKVETAPAPPASKPAETAPTAAKQEAADTRVPSQVETAPPTSEANADDAETASPAPEPSETPAPNATPAVSDGEGAPALGSPYLQKREGMYFAAVTLARGVEKNAERKHVPVEPGHSFENDGRRVYAIFDVENPNEEAVELMVGWIPPGSDKEQARVPLTVKPEKSWRTWAFNSRVAKPGLWQVVVRDSEDAVVARASFEMKE